MPLEIVQVMNILARSKKMLLHQGHQNENQKRKNPLIKYHNPKQKNKRKLMIKKCQNQNQKIFRIQCRKNNYLGKMLRNFIMKVGNSLLNNKNKITNQLLKKHLLLVQYQVYLNQMNLRVLLWMFANVQRYLKRIYLITSLKTNKWIANQIQFQNKHLSIFGKLNLKMKVFPKGLLK